MTDMNSPIDFDTWWALYGELKGSPWETEDLASAVEGIAPVSGPFAVEALKYVHNRARGWEGPIDPEDAVAAVLTAVYEFRASNEWTPTDAKKMADHFAVYYREIEDPLQDQLDGEYNRMPLEWLGDHGRRELEKEIRKASEIWIDESLGSTSGVWVFNRPNHTVLTSSRCFT